MRMFMTTVAAASLMAGGAMAQTSIMTNDVKINGDQVTLSDVKADQDGYIVLHAVLDGKPVVPASIGHAMVKKGDNKNVVITSDYPLVNGEDYVAMLHVESNGNQTYDFGPGSTKVDTPVMKDGKIALSQFTATNTAAASGMTPKVMGKQAMIEGSLVTVPAVVAAKPGYVVIHEAKDGKPVVPQSIGHAAVKAGTNENIQITTDKQLKDGKEYILMLHEETNGNSSYDFGPGSTDVDTPVMADGNAVTTPFTAMTVSAKAKMKKDNMSPMIDTTKADIDGSSATFKDVVAASDGYLVLHATKDGKPVVPANIGHVAVKAGDNRNVTVKTTVPLKEGETYAAMLHDETNGNRSYDFAKGATDVDTPTMANGKPVIVTFGG